MESALKRAVTVASTRFNGFGLCQTTVSTVGGGLVDLLPGS
jgi:hypothetical protein